MSCVGRERAFQFFSRRNGSPGMLIRLSYAIDMRYGVLHDLGAKVLRGETIDLTMGHVNVIWQGDACSQSLRALRHCTVPSAPLNVSGPEIVSIRSLALAFGRRFGKPPVFTGHENATAWIANTSRAARPVWLSDRATRTHGRVDQRLARTRNGKPRQSHPFRRAYGFLLGRL